jgi:hypothetical protein
VEGMLAGAGMTLTRWTTDDDGLYAILTAIRD